MHIGSNQCAIIFLFFFKHEFCIFFFFLLSLFFSVQSSNTVICVVVKIIKTRVIKLAFGCFYLDFSFIRQKKKKRERNSVEMCGMGFFVNIFFSTYFLYLTRANTPLLRSDIREATNIFVRYNETQAYCLLPRVQ